ncbi:MAG: DUF5927 domain-containing protein [Roseinatronobacter sp.]
MSMQTAPADPARLGVVMLAHVALDRAAQVARFWLAAGCPVVLHLDARVAAPQVQALKADLGAHPLLRYSDRFRCNWGSWGLVAATQAASTLMLRDFPDVGHVLLSSGACLPLRPARDLIAHLEARPDTDFIESVAIDHASWIMGGLSEERFTLYFPFDWRRQRWLFDTSVAVQRRLKIRRAIPEPLRPHMGSQWWCLTRATLQAILTDPARSRYERHFRQNWIPDEAYFQTLARLHARQIESRSLTLVKFDRHGRPNLFYDDHLTLLRHSDCFLARKIWPQAERLYAYFLSEQPATEAPVAPDPARIDRYFALAEQQRQDGRAGLYMQSRFPRADTATAKSAAPYVVLTGFDQVFPDFENWLSIASGARVHGHLYAPERVQFHRGATVWHGALSNSAAIRDYNPRMFLTNLLWATRPERQVFFFGPGDMMDGHLTWFMATDAKATIRVIRGAWAFALWRADQTDAQAVARAAYLHGQENAWIDALSSRHVMAQVQILTLGDVLADPSRALRKALDGIVTPEDLARHTLPEALPAAGFEAYLHRLRDHGLPAQIVSAVLS